MRLRRLSNLTLTALLVVLGIGAGWTLRGEGPTEPPAHPSSAQAELQTRVLNGHGAFAAQDYYRLYPDDFPIAWGGASTGRSWRQLSGSAKVRLAPSRASTRLLIVPTCAGASRSVDWTLSAAEAGTIARGEAACGHIEGSIEVLPARLRGRPLRLDLSSKSSDGYAVSVFEQ